MEPKKTYLGDGLYAEFDGYEIQLKANMPATDTVHLDNKVFDAFMNFVKEIKWIVFRTRSAGDE